MQDTIDIGNAVAFVRSNAGWLDQRDYDFAMSLVASFDRYGRLTDRQEPYIFKMQDRINRMMVQSERAELTFPVLPDKILSVAERNPDAAAAGRVRIVLDMEPRLAIKVMGDRSRRAGDIAVLEGEGKGRLVGYISKVDGSFEPSLFETASNHTLEVLQAFDSDLEGMAAAFGQRFGVCSFCARTLTDPRSVDVGYGPTCAGSYGLPWG